MKINVSDIRTDWLIEQMPTFELEAAARYEFQRMQFEEPRIEEMISTIKPDFRSRWQAFIGEARPDDSLWYFRSSRESWSSLSGRAGFAIVREGVPVSGFLTWKS